MLIARQRMSYFDELLQACGWTRVGDSWMPPEVVRKQLEVQKIEVPVSRSVAVAVQIQRDEAVVKAWKEGLSDTARPHVHVTLPSTKMPAKGIGEPVTA